MRSAGCSASTARFDRAPATTQLSATTPNISRFPNAERPSTKTIAFLPVCKQGPCFTGTNRKPDIAANRPRHHTPFLSATMPSERELQISPIVQESLMQNSRVSPVHLSSIHLRGRPVALGPNPQPQLAETDLLQQRPLPDPTQPNLGFPHQITTAKTALLPLTTPPIADPL